MVLMKVDKHGRGTFPEEVRRDLRLDSEEGGVVFLHKTGRGTYELVSAALLPQDQFWFHHPEMQKRMEAAAADFDAGRSTRTVTPEAAQAFLDGLKG
jgi:bifunctional DNA-binding transcriptional regulator/antitoxin component of YhaV-PrlF toxin-antitoxin module